MRLTKSKNANINYLAKIVDLKEFHSHPDPEVTKLKCTYVDGYNIIVGIDNEPGKYVYFPTSSTINPQLLSFANLYRHSEKNYDSGQTGMFEDNGRVKAIRLRGCVSEGFLLPIDVFNNWIIDSTNLSVDDVDAGVEFDTVEHNGKSFWVCKKYIVQRTFNNGSQRNYNHRQKNLKNFDKVIDTQFRYHYDTILIRKEPTAIQPNDWIQLTYKIHGTSGISSYVLTKHPINILKRIGNVIAGRGFKPYEEKYDYLYSSRSVIKNQYYNKKVGNGYYGVDVWFEADKYLRPYLQKGMSMYYEIVGFLPSGGFIQKNYDYGCVPPEGKPYTPEKHFKVRIYRITMTNVDGVVHEFSPREVQIWCKRNNLIPVEECYYGKACDLYPDLNTEVNWSEKFIERLASDKNFYMEMNSPHCVNNVPHEGLVIKIDNMRSAAFKLKCFAFLGKIEQPELDKGVCNIEDLN